MPSVIAPYAVPAFLRLERNLTAAKFELMKFTPAKRILDDALASGRLPPGGQVIESSSGTFALALSILCSLYGLKLTLVTGPVSEIVRWRLENLGATLHIVEASRNCEGGIQQARLEVLHRLLADNPTAFWPQQYTNPLNAASYREIAQDYLDRGRRVDTIVGTVGSGGSLFGFARLLSLANPNLKVVAVDHNRSVVFGAEARRITRMCRETFEQILAMGAGIPMGNVEHGACDEVHWVPVPRMVQKVHSFHRKTGLLVGPSSGAALTVAEWYARNEPDREVLTILPDHGVRYVETMFDPHWLDTWAQDIREAATAPIEIERLGDVAPQWCRLKWCRRSFEEMAGRPQAPRPAGYQP